jgi:rubrerythrin
LIEYYLLALSMVLLFAITARVLRKSREGRIFLEKSYNEKKIARKSTKLLEESSTDKTCRICFGSIEGGTVAECSCGNSFHVSCAEPTSRCPYCDSPYGQMVIRGARTSKCPFCGERMTSDICVCGTVYPFEDGTFRCVCGEPMHMSVATCPECGAKYETFMAVPGETV